MIFIHCLGIFPSDGQEWKRDKTRKVRFIYKTFICLENIINKIKRLSQNLMENKIEAGMSDK